MEKKLVGKRTPYKEMYPGSLGIFTLEELKRLKFGCLDFALFGKLSAGFMTVSEAAAIMGTMPRNAGQCLKACDAMILSGKKYFLRSQAEAVTDEWNARAKSARPVRNRSRRARQS